MTAEQSAAQDLLLDLASALHEVQVPADEVDAMIRATAKALSLDAQLVLMQTFGGLELRFGQTEAAALRRIPYDAHWKLRRMEALVGLTGRIANGKCSVAEAQRELLELNARKPAYAKWLVVLAYGVYGAAVAVRVGGAWKELAVGLVLGAIVGVLHYGAVHHRRVDLAQTFLAAVAATFAAGLALKLIGPFDFARTLFGGVVLMVPAMVVTIATHELANEALESGTIRLVFGALRFLMVGFGVLAAARTWSLFFELPTVGESQPLPHLVVLGVLVVGAVALMVCLQASPKDIVWIVAGVMVAYWVQELTKLKFEGGAPFASALVLGVAGQLYARLPGRFAPTVIVPGMLQIAPGFLGVQAVLQFIKGHAPAQGAAFHVVLVSLQLVMGLFLASTLVRSKSPAATI